MVGPEKQTPRFYRIESESRAEAYPLGYVEGLNDARTTLADFFSILLQSIVR